MKIKMPTLVNDWKRSWRWFSMNCMTLAAAIQGAWIYVPDDMRATVPVWLVSAVTIGLLVLGVVGRLIKQKGAE